MKKTIQLLMMSFLAVSINAQEITVDLSMGAQYPDEIYFNLETETDVAFTAASWDVAFLRNDNFDVGIRVNDGIGIRVYEVANTPAGYDTVDVTDQGDWVQLYNDPTEIKSGAFQQASAAFGWGEYNPATNTVDGTIVFVLEYEDGTFRKIFFESYFGGYTFKHATWTGTAWSSDVNKTVSNSSNPDRIYNYYSLVNENEVVGEPAEGDWDFVFTRWLAFIDPPGLYNPVTGVLQNPNVTVAQVEETGAADPNGLEYLAEANTIGWDWKAFGGTGFTVDSDQKYYVKTDANTVYRMYFTEFEGSSTGNLQFIYENVSDILGIESVSESVSFGMYPNPTTDGQLTIVFENNTASSENNTIAIFAMNGAKVFHDEVGNRTGFYTKLLDLSALQTGVYMVRFSSGVNSITKKLIIN